MKNIFLLFIVGLVFSFNLIYSANFKDIPMKIHQPDGTIINCFASGDEFFNYLHDGNGYTIIRGQGGWYYYATTDANLKIIPSQIKVGIGNPDDAGIAKGIKITEKDYKAKVSKYLAPLQLKGTKAPATGSFNNVVIYIRFADDSGMDYTRQTYLDMFTGTGGQNYSVQEYFSNVSYNQLTVNAYHFPTCAPTTNLSYQDGYNRGYYQPYDASVNPDGYTSDDDARIREHSLLKNAINSLSGVIQSTLTAGQLDMDNNGYVDNISFIVSGGNDAWSDLLWAHRWALYSYSVYINGKRVWDYNFQPEAQSSSRTTCHELFHCIGSPDLYHYYYNTDVSPASYWDIMEYGTGSMTAYMKEQIGGWISIPQITTNGTYTLNPLALSSNNAFKIPFPNSSTEFLVVEFRKKTGVVESKLSQYADEGLLIYRINTNVSIDEGNRNGPPDMLWVYRPNGDTNTDGSPWDATFSSTQGRTTFNATSNPECHLSNDATWGQVSITNIGAVGTTISFNVTLQGYDVTFNVTDGTNPVSGAVVNYRGLSKTTNTSGQVIFSGVQNGSTTYSISKTGYTDATGTINVSGSNYIKNVVLSSNLYNVTFNVTDGSNPVYGASITFNSLTQSTNSLGTTVFANVTNGTKAYTVTKTGYNSSSGNVIINGSAVTQNVVISLKTITELASSSCGSNHSDLQDWVSANSVLNAGLYEFAFTDVLGGSPNLLQSSFYGIRLVSVPNIKYNSTYYVCVRAKIGETWGDFGDTCLVTINSKTTKLNTTSCGTTHSDLRDWVSADIVSGADLYEFEFDDIGDGAPITLQTAFYGTRLISVPGLKYNVTYNVRVRSRLAGVWQNFGETCQVIISSKLTKLATASCGSNHISLLDWISAISVSGAELYEFEFTNISTEEINTFQSTFYGTRLKAIPGIALNNTYNVRVHIRLSGIWQEYGDICTVSTNTSKFAENDQLADDFEFELYPNPFIENINIKLTGKSDIPVTVNVFDLTGKIVFSDSVFPEQLNKIGLTVPSGIYIVKMERGEYLKTARIIKMN